MKFGSIIAAGNVQNMGNAAIIVPSTPASWASPTPTPGMLRLNTDTGLVEFFNTNAAWSPVHAYGRTRSLDATQFDNPSTSGDWHVKAVAPAQADPISTSLIVRAFDDSVAEAIGFTATVPAGTISITFRIRYRANTAPTATTNNKAVFLFAYRSIADGTNPSTWATMGSIATAPVGVRSFQTHAVTFSLAQTTPILAGVPMQWQLARDAASASDNLVGDLYVVDMSVEYR